ncbi:hypothetical protein F5883DRAFT_639781 [Diaporthe sp. PMI_573]|nr:hypothetical protein F5883DRAFT_639781 [Diaporthaceae sp. PMI_573]
MQATDRVHPGGNPAQSQPYDEIPRHGKVNFRRRAPKTTGEKQGKPENDFGTNESVEIPGQEEAGEELVDGYLYAWASNVCHLEDTKVQVEDLSDRDIDGQLAQGVQYLLSEVLKCNAEKKSQYSRSQQLEGIVTEEFTTPGPVGNWRVCRKTYCDIDVRSKKNGQYSRSTIAKQILEEAQAKAGPAPSDAQVKHVACRIVTQNGGKLPDGPVAKKGPTLLRQAHEELYTHRNDASFQRELEQELEAATERPTDQTREILCLVEKALPRRKENKFHQFVLDQQASNACERVEGFDIVILRDRNDELICGVVTEALQKLWPAGTVGKMGTAVETFAWRFPFKKPDDLRHPTSKAVHLAQFPDKDVHSEECKQPHFAVCGVEHYGVHHETGYSKGFKGLCFQEFSWKTQDCPALLKSSAWKEEFPKLKGGVYGIAEKMSRLSLKSWDPKLYGDYLEVLEFLPETLRMTLATTGGDLVLKELGVRIPFPSGSNCHLRGEGLQHLITGYDGIRHSIVLTNKESVRRTYPDFRNRYREEMAKLDGLQSKDPKDWSDDEVKLKEASEEGKSAVLELIWRSGKEKRKAGDSQGETPEQPPKKKTKKTTTTTETTKTTETPTSQ